MLTSTSTSSSSPVRVLVIGYGLLGNSILRGLTSSEYAERISASLLVRPSSLTSSDPTKAAALAAIRQLGVTLVAGDVTADTATLTETLRGFDTVISTIEIVALRQQIPLVQAAAAAGVRHFIPSEFSFGLEEIGRGSVIRGFDDKLDVRAAVRRSGVDYTFIEVGVFAEFLISPFFGVNIAERTVSAAGSMDATVTVTSVGDIGALTAAAVLSPSARNRTIRFAGDRVTYNDVAAAIESLSDERVTVTRSARSAADIEKLIADKPDDMIARFNLLVAKQTGLIWNVDETWNAANAAHYKTTTVRQLISDQINNAKAASAASAASAAAAAQ